MYTNRFGCYAFALAVLLPSPVMAELRSTCGPSPEGFRCIAVTDGLKWVREGAGQRDQRAEARFFSRSAEAGTNVDLTLRERCFGNRRSNPDGNRWRGTEGWTCFRQVVQGRSRIITARAGERGLAALEALLGAQPWSVKPSPGVEWTLVGDDPALAHRKCEEGFEALARLDRTAAERAFDEATGLAARPPLVCALAGRAVVDMLTATLYRRMERPAGRLLGRVDRLLYALDGLLEPGNVPDPDPVRAQLNEMDMRLVYAVRIAFESLTGMRRPAPGTTRDAPLGRSERRLALAPTVAPVCPGSSGEAPRTLDTRCVVYAALLSFSELAEYEMDRRLESEAAERLRSTCRARGKDDEPGGRWRIMRVCSLWVDALEDPTAFDPWRYEVRHPRGVLGSRRDGWLAPVGLALLEAGRAGEALGRVGGGSDSPEDPLDAYVYVRAEWAELNRVAGAGQTKGVSPRDSSLVHCARHVEHRDERWWRLDWECARQHALRYAEADLSSDAALEQWLMATHHQLEALWSAFSQLDADIYIRRSRVRQMAKADIALSIAEQQTHFDERCREHTSPRCDQRPRRSSCDVLRQVRRQVGHLADERDTAWAAAMNQHCGPAPRG